MRHRGINVPAPKSLRYNPAVLYTDSNLYLPCMVAAIQAPDRSITAIHRTWIRDDGQGKAGVDQADFVNRLPGETPVPSPEARLK